MKKESESKNTIYLVGFDISSLDQRKQYFLASAAVFILWMLYSYLQEIIFKIEKMPYKWFHTFLQCTFYSLFCIYDLPFISNGKNSPLSRAPTYHYALTASLLLIARVLGNMSFKYLDYTTKLVFGSAKVIPVALIGIILGKNYNRLQYLSLVFLIFGVLMFVLADSNNSPDFNILGVFFACISVVSEASKSNYNEELMKRYGSSAGEMSFFTNVFCFIACVPLVSFYDEIGPGVEYFTSFPKMMALELLLFIVGHFATLSLITLTQLTDALQASVIASLREVCTIALSFIAFSKPVSPQHMIGASFFVSGIFLQVYNKIQHYNRLKID